MKIIPFVVTACLLIQSHVCIAQQKNGNSRIKAKTALLKAKNKAQIGSLKKQMLIKQGTNSRNGCQVDIALAQHNKKSRKTEVSVVADDIIVLCGR